MKTVFSISYICLIFLLMHPPLLMSSQDTLINLSEHYGIFYVPNYGEWLPSPMSNNDFFVFEHKNSGATVKIKKEQVSVLSSQEFNQQILKYINGLGRNQEFVELRKQFVPIRVLSQKGTHFLKIKSRLNSTTKFVLNPEVDKKLFHIEILENKSGNEPSEDVIRFISLLSLQPISAADIAAANTKDKLKPQDQIKHQNEKDDLSSFKKAKTPDNVIEKNTGGNDSDYDPVVSDMANKIPDGDEEAPIINEIGKESFVPQDAGWALGLLKNPKELLNALDGGRPGGEVNTMVALLRQMQGPLEESEEKALLNQYTPHANSSSPKGRNSIKTQNEMLLRAMLHNQLAVQTAWEYDFALSSYEMAKLMEDEDEMQISLMLAEIQELLMDDQHQQIQTIIGESQRAEQVPSADELIAEDTEMRNNAIRVVESIYEIPAGTLQSGGSGGVADENYAMVQRYFALREEHKVLKESCDAGAEAACKEATEIYREAMDVRKKLEAKGVDVFTYKPKEPLDPNPFIGKEYLEPIPSKQDPSLSDEQNQAIAEHEYNIAAAQRAMASFRNEMLNEQDPVRREQLRLQALHMAQNIHDSKDLIESIRTGSIVKTRGPWDEHSAVVLAETSRKLREDFQRASQMQASYVHMLNVLKKYNPEEAKKWSDLMHSNVTKGIFDKGGFERAQSALNELHKIAKGTAQTEQRRLEVDQTKAFERLETVERHLRYAENIKSGCDKAIFVGTLFTGMAPGLLLSMAYEGATTAAEKGPVAALKNVGIQVATMIAMKGIMKAGSWGINKILNPKVAPTNSNKWKDILDANRYQQEMEWNKALVSNLKDKVVAFEKAKAAGGKKTTLL
jgi:hypothetical protein